MYAVCMFYVYVYGPQLSEIHKRMDEWMKSAVTLAFSVNRYLANVY